MNDSDLPEDFIWDDEKDEIDHEISELKNDIEYTLPYGQFLASEVNLYFRLLSALTNELRRKLIEKAYKEFYPVEKSLGARDYSLQQFIAYHYCEAMFLETKRFGQLEEDAVLNKKIIWDFKLDDFAFALSGPHEVRLTELDETEKRAVSSILKGENPYGLGAILAMTINIADNPAEGIKSLEKTVLDVIRRPKEAALLIGGVHYNRSDVTRHEVICEVQLGDIDGLARRSGQRRKLFNQIFHDEVAFLKELVSQLEVARKWIIGVQQKVFSLESLCSKYGFEETPTGLLIPIKSNIIIAGSMKEAIMRAEKDREEVLSMSPRRFEEFMAFIFKELGFEVELTQCTRDGGADILCMKNLHGLPFRLAIEAKRYRDRPISVTLVRSFVGSNKVFQANKLLFITTSRYTMPAMEYADQYVSHLLTLKQYDQIQEWCRHLKSKMF